MGPSLFSRRLALDGIQEPELLQLLAEPAENPSAREAAPAAWLVRLAEAYSRSLSSSVDDRPLAAALGGDPNLAFLRAFEPLIEAGMHELEQHVRRLAERDPDAPIDPAVAPRLFLPILLGQLGRLSIRSFALELGIARMQGELSGATPEARFESFVRRLSDREFVLEFLSHQPVLARRAVQAVERWRDASTEFLGRLAADRGALADAFFGKHPLGRLTGFQSGIGDAHSGGRSVAIVAFDSGQRLVYKPRSLAVESRFRELVAFLNSAGLEPHLAGPEILDRGTHGWVEFVSARDCGTRDQVRDFYRRQGSWLALLHVLGATDLHYENVIAAGEHPIPIDLETLFHPRAHQRGLEDPGERLVRAAVLESVLRVGLLPNRIGDSEAGAGADLGGLSGRGGQETPDELVDWDRPGTDELRATRRKAQLPAAHNRPVLDGTPVGVEEHVPEILAGFRSAWELLRERREELLDPRGPIARFAGVELRAVVRATRFYGLLLEESLHPDFQCDALELEHHFDRLWTGVAELPHLERVIAAERADLLADDVPVFHARADSRDAWDSRGRRIEELWQASGFEVTRERFGALGDVERERQEWLIRGSLAASAVSEQDPRWPRYTPVAGTAVIDDLVLGSRALAAARAIGRRLEALALRDDEGNAAWMGFLFVGLRWDLAALPDDLYGGVPGVALFLEYLARVDRDESFSALARAGMAELVRDAKRSSRLASVGAFNGLGGLVYAFSHLACLRRDDELLARAAECAALAEERLALDQDLDVVGGAAGLLVALESLHALDPRPRWERLMRACAEHIAEHARRLRTGVGWVTRIGGSEPVTGFSHGAAGITWALQRLHRRDGEERWLEVAREGMRFENSLFDEHARNWLDPGSRRVGGAASSDDPTTTTAWCYGAPGIGLARIAASASDSTGEAQRDLVHAFDTTCATGFGRNHSLCHGALGNLEFLTRAAEALGRSQPEQEARRRAEVRGRVSSVLASLEKDGVLCGVPLGVESPSLMNGLAGIGLGLLRLARPHEVPSVLTLETPVR